MTTAVNDIIDQAEEILQDTSNARWAAAELEDWLNEAQRVIANNVDDADILRADLTTAAGAEQDLSSLTRFGRVIDVVRIVSTNRALRRGDKAMLDSLRPTWRTDTETASTELWFYDENEPNKIEVYPPVLVSEALDIVYSAVPAAAAIGGNITIGDQYSPAILEYMLYRAFSKDTEDVASDLGRAAVHFTTFSNLIGIKQVADAAFRPEAR